MNAASHGNYYFLDYIQETHPEPKTDSGDFKKSTMFDFLMYFSSITGLKRTEQYRSILSCFIKSYHAPVSQCPNYYGFINFCREDLARLIEDNEFSLALKLIQMGVSCDHISSLLVDKYKNGQIDRYF